MKGKKVLIATGGTGGHVYPAEALAQQLKKVDTNELRDNIFPGVFFFQTKLYIAYMFPINPFIPGVQKPYSARGGGFGSPEVRKNDCMLSKRISYVTKLLDFS